MVALNELSLMHEAGGISIWDNVSKTSIGVSIEEINVERNLIILEKNEDDLNNYSYLEYEYLKKKGLITNKEYDEITGYIKSELAEQSANEENYYAELARNEKSSQKESGKIGSEEPPAKPTRPAESEVKEYRYKMNARPFDIGTYPKEGFIKSENDPQGGFQILTYDRKLTAKERNHWSFLPLTEIDELKDKQFADKDGEFFVDLEWLPNNIGADVSMFDNKNQLIEKPFFMSTDEVLKNVESGYWVEKAWGKPEVKETTKPPEFVGEVLETRKPQTPDQQAQTYIRGIKNKLKKDYARDYNNWILKGKQEGKEPGRKNDLSYMVAQAVRMELDKIYGEKVKEEKPEPKKVEFAGEILEQKPKAPERKEIDTKTVQGQINLLIDFVGSEEVANWKNRPN
jgi:hypothetical protein